MTHVNNRYNYTEIVRQIAEEADVDVLLGGGRAEFTTDRLDAMIANGYSVVENRTSMLNVTSGRLLGLFASGYMDYEIARNFSTTPSLSEMCNKSLELLSTDPDGFFLMIEGGRIDHAGHANNRTNVALETIEFNQAVKIALDYVTNYDNTVLLITADHETGGLMVVSDDLSDELPSAGNSMEANRTLRIARANNVTVTWEGTSHTAANVPFFSYGSSIGNLSQNEIIDNIDVFGFMNSTFFPENVTTTTTTTTPPPATNTTTTTTLNTTHPHQSKQRRQTRRRVHRQQQLVEMMRTSLRHSCSFQQV
jgi:alkaline phosphatase